MTEGAGTVLLVGSVGELVTGGMETRGRLEGRELGVDFPTEEPKMGEPFFGKSDRGDVVIGEEPETGEVCRGGFVKGNLLTERGLREGDLLVVTV